MEENKDTWNWRSKIFWTEGWGSLFLAVFIALFIPVFLS
jgi:signal peptidase I